ncbi:MAG: hypothetical protein EPN84_10375 [Legionella sp.]|nr:MAG: hypothetical protein EPN84_10375 [Legionella sp.]
MAPNRKDGIDNHNLLENMNYYLTEHYARGEEKPIAAFIELGDAQLCMEKKSSTDVEEGKKVIYRLYNDHELLHQLNVENISTSHANYAEGNGDFNSDTFTFQIMMRTINSLEQKSVAQFNHEHDAYLFIASKFEEDTTINENDLFLLFKNNSLIDTLNKTIIENRNKESSRTNQKEATYKLSPLSTRPTPGGGPADYWVKDEDE